MFETKDIQSLYIVICRLINKCFRGMHLSCMHSRNPQMGVPQIRIRFSNVIIQQRNWWSRSPQMIHSRLSGLPLPTEAASHRSSGGCSCGTVPHPVRLLHELCTAPAGMRTRAPASCGYASVQWCHRRVSQQVLGNMQAPDKTHPDVISCCACAHLALSDCRNPAGLRAMVASASRTSSHARCEQERGSSNSACPRKLDPKATSVVACIWYAVLLVVIEETTGADDHSNANLFRISAHTRSPEAAARTPTAGRFRQGHVSVMTQRHQHMHGSVIHL